MSPSYNPDDAVRGPLFADGTYEAYVKRADLRHATTGSQMIVLILTIRGQDNERTDVFDNLVFHPRALWRIQQFCDAVGIDFSRGNLEAADCEGLEMGVSVGQETYNGRQKNVIKDYLPRMGMPPRRVDPDADIPF